MKKILSVVCLIFAGTQLSAQHLVDVDFLNTTPSQTYALITNKAVFDVDLYKLTYLTEDVNGGTTIASGALAIPKNTFCDSLPMLVYEHGTVLEKENVPSRDNGEAFITKAFASAGFISVSPDYLGLGDNSDLHPYLHARSEATATIDLIRACREFMRDSLNVNFSREVVITGYSQGGHAAMATAKYIQDSSLLTEFKVAAVAPASGPYNLAGVQAEALIHDQPYSNPGYIPYLFFGMNQVYGNIFQNYSDILKSPYDTLVPPLFDGTFSMAAVNAVLPNKLSGFVQDSVLVNFKNDSVQKDHPLWQMLIKNDNHNWAPSFPMKLFYCTMDEQVSYENAIATAAAMQTSGAAVTAENKGAFNHSGCVLPSLQGALNFFIANANVCTQVGVEEASSRSELSFYPVPVKNRLYFEGVDGTATVEIIDGTGRRILSKEVNLQEPLSLAQLKPGVYTLLLKKGRNRVSRKLVIE